MRAQFVQSAIQLGLRYGLTDIPRIDDPSFVSALVFDTRAGDVGVPKSRFAYLFPSKNAALIQVRLRPDLSEEERRRAIELIEEATQQRAFRPQEGARYIVTGVPVVTEGLADAVQRSIFVLLAAALLVMAATLALVFRSRLRLLPLALALAAAAMTFGALSLAGGSLTMASIAVLPVLIGLAVDYAIQFQARFDEALAGADGRAHAERRRERGAVAAASAGGPTILTAGIATAVGFLVLLLSPVPMVRGFGALLVLGIALALAVRGLRGLRRARALPRRPAARLRPARLRRIGRRAACARAPTGASMAPASGSRTAPGARSARRSPIRAGCSPSGSRSRCVGLALDTQSEVVSDVRELVPRDLQALEDVNALQEETGVSGEIDVTVRADDITDPEVIAWMTKFQDGVLRAHGYRPGKRCGQAENPPELCPALSLPDLFETAGRGQEQVRALLDAVPPYLSQGVVTADRRTANLAFGIRLMPLDRQKEVVDDIKGRLDPPAGVEASVVGLPVLAAEANGALSSPWRRALTLLGRARRRLPRAARRPALGARGRGAADPDRARHRLVGADPVPARPAARPARGRPQPDVGHARRARDRDHDGVQRAALVALPPGARRAAPGRRARSSSPTPPPARRCSPRAPPRSPASRR